VESGPPSSILYNDSLTLSGIPAEVYDYRLGNRSALDRFFSLSPANEVPLETNPADAGGVLGFTNNPTKPPTISGASALCRNGALTHVEKKQIDLKI